MTFDERRYLKLRRSEIQRAKEIRARQLHIKTRWRENLYMGGGSRPVTEQVRSGYPE